MIHKTFMLIMIPILSLVSALYQGIQEPQNELPVGEWLGSARAGGSTKADQSGLTIRGVGDFNVNLEFAVATSGPLEGSWTMEGTSDWVLTKEGFSVNAFMDHKAEGPISGDRRQFSLGVAQINSDITVAVPNVSTQELKTTDPIGPINLNVTGIYCDDAFGEWILSWNSELLEQGYTPTFGGDWYAVRQAPEFTDAQSAIELFTELDRLNQEIENTIKNAPVEDGLTRIDPQVLWGFIHEMVEAHNKLRNLSQCDREFFGDENVERWIYITTANLRWGTYVFFENLEENDLFLDGIGFMQLSSALLGAGAIGAGAIVPIDGTVEVELQQGLEKILESELSTPTELQGALIAAEMLNLNVPEDFDMSRVEEGGS